jgi:hypothetical protein
MHNLMPNKYFKDLGYETMIRGIGDVLVINSQQLLAVNIPAKRPGKPIKSRAMPGVHGQFCAFSTMESKHDPHSVQPHS